MEKGFGSEMIKLVIQYVFEELKLNRLQLEVFSHNPRGIRGYEKCGFVKEGILREALFMTVLILTKLLCRLLEKTIKNKSIKRTS